MAIGPHRLEIVLRSGIMLEIDVSTYGIELDPSTRRIADLHFGRMVGERELHYLDPSEVVCITTVPIPGAVPFRERAAVVN